MSSAQTSPIKVTDPMRIYVLWHANCKDGQTFAKGIFKWFRGDPKDISQCGYGIPVEYRSYPFQADSVSEILEIKPNEAKINVIVPLVDEHMVSNQTWQDYLLQFIDASKFSETACLICPVEIHKSAYQLPEKITRLNFLRINRANDPPDLSETELFEIQRQRLLSLLTQVCCRLLWRENSDSVPGVINLDVASSPIKVFISHAKSDGTDIAEVIREQIYQQGQLQAFFDESDIAIGHAWQQSLESNTQFGTQAMIAIFTDTYASRPWCRNEIRLAREVTSRQPKKDNPYAWHIKPLIVVDALENGSNYFLPEFGYAPVVRWKPEQPEQVKLIVDQLLREILFYGYNEKRAALLKPTYPDQHNLNCNPDSSTLLELWNETKQNLKKIVIPPPGLSLSEEEKLTRLFTPQPQIMTFDEVEEGHIQNAFLSCENNSSTERKLIAVSISNSSNILEFGRGINHLHELIINVARMVLRAGGNLAYGGDLRLGGFTEKLFSLGRGEHAGEGWKHRLYSYIAWPYYQRLTVAQEAELLNICSFVRVGPEFNAIKSSDNKFDLNNSTTTFQEIRYLSYMRELMTRGKAKLLNTEETPAISARIVIGGKTQNYMGIMPGIFEECLLSIRNSVPTYILGGFGGAAHCLTKVLQANDPTLEIAAKDYPGTQVELLANQYEENPAERYSPYPDGPNTRQLYGELNQYLAEIRKSNFSKLNNGLSFEDNKLLMETSNSKTIIALLRKGLRAVT
ncbi:MAG: toll/interleukin-1 receptor domain-containing protein [Leptolyngbya sp. SIO3F4]|nr:toll/interleukin-1 receptor domain-containing protein [Leptolyngbya sp. SIO3F4]